MSWMALFMILPPGVRSTDDIPAGYNPPSLGSRDDVLALLRKLDPDLDASKPDWVYLPLTADQFEVKAGDSLTSIGVRNPSDELIEFIWSNTNWSILHVERGVVLLPEADEDDEMDDTE